MILCFDIGGSKIAAGLVKKGRVYNFQKFNWQKSVTTKKFINQIIKIIKNYKLIKNFDAIAVGIAGQIDKSGNVYLSGHLNHKRQKVALKKILYQKFHLPVIIENDAHSFALGEAIFGQGKNKNFVVVLTLGTGIGGGIVLNKKIVEGKDGFAGEFGHMKIRAEGEKCSCGQRGCFEVYASVTALKKVYKKLSHKKISGYLIDQAFKKKDKNAILAAQKVTADLALGLANIINILNPEIIVLGGGLSRFEDLMNMAIKKVKPLVIIPRYQTKILISKLKDKAPLIGIASLVKK